MPVNESRPIPTKDSLSLKEDAVNDGPEKNTKEPNEHPFLSLENFNKLPDKTKEVFLKIPPDKAEKLQFRVLAMIEKYAEKDKQAEQEEKHTVKTANTKKEIAQKAVVAIKKAKENPTEENITNALDYTREIGLSPEEAVQVVEAQPGGQETEVGGRAQTHELVKTRNKYGTEVVTEEVNAEDDREIEWQKEFGGQNIGSFLTMDEIALFDKIAREKISNDPRINEKAIKFIHDKNPKIAGALLENGLTTNGELLHEDLLRGWFDKNKKEILSVVLPS